MSDAGTSGAHLGGSHLGSKTVHFGTEILQFLTAI